MVCLFDNEEVGSVSVAGADSNLLQVAIKRIAETPIAGSNAVLNKVRRKYKALRITKVFETLHALL